MENDASWGSGSWIWLRTGTRCPAALPDRRRSDADVGHRRLVAGDDAVGPVALIDVDRQHVGVALRVAGLQHGERRLVRPGPGEVVGLEPAAEPAAPVGGDDPGAGLGADG